MNLLILLLAGLFTAIYFNAGDGEELHQSDDGPRRLLLILIDGFRHDYLYHQGLTGIPRLRTQGVHAAQMETIYPAETYPGLYSLATGLYGESHGMVLNYMYDPMKHLFFLAFPDLNPGSTFWWEEAEPIWITTTRLGLPTGMFHWPGGGVKIRDRVAKLVKPYENVDGVETFRDHLNEALQHLNNRSLQFAMVYCEHVDAVGHRWGPGSANLRSAVKEIDFVFNEMLDTIEYLGLKNSLSVVIASDHGMAASDSQSMKPVNLDNALDPDDVELVLDRGSHSGIYPKKGREAKVLEDLKKLQGVDVYLRSQIPERFHIRENSRVPPVYLVVKKGFFLHGIKVPSKQIPGSTPDGGFKGFHGYDPADPDMQGIFLAFGPELRRNFVIPSIVQTDPYNLIAYLLGIRPQPNNGSWARVSNMLIKTITNPVELSENRKLISDCNQTDHMEDSKVLQRMKNVCRRP